MKFSVTILAQALLAASTFAVPHGGGLSKRLARRATRRSSHPQIPASGDTEGPEGSNVQYSSNWSGAVLTSPPSGSTFTSVSAQFTVPNPKSVDGKAGAASAWVGIDGDTYQNAILQTGLDFNVDASGAVSYDAWYEWYPNPSVDFSGISFKAGDNVAISVVAPSTTHGVATIHNLSSGQTVHRNMTAPSSSSALGGQNAEWIVEDFESNGSLVSFCNFGTVTFSDATAGLSSGSSVGTDGSVLMDIRQNNKILTSANTPSSSSITVTYA